MRQVGCALFALGIAITLCAGAKLPAPPPAETAAGPQAMPHDQVDRTAGSRTGEDAGHVRAQFPDTLPVFCFGAGVALCGLVLWRVGARTRAKLTETVDGATDPADPLVILHGLQQPLGKLESDLEDLQSESLLQALDDLNERFVMPLVESRGRVTDLLGMSAGAEILVTAAVGERMLNRAWSAAADAHLPEARASIREAVHAFREADRLAQEKP